jgi:hypothetical protein
MCGAARRVQSSLTLLVRSLGALGVPPSRPTEPHDATAHPHGMACETKAVYSSISLDGVPLRSTPRRNHLSSSCTVGAWGPCVLPVELASAAGLVDAVVVEDGHARTEWWRSKSWTAARCSRWVCSCAMYAAARCCFTCCVSRVLSSMPGARPWATPGAVTDVEVVPARTEGTASSTGYGSMRAQHPAHGVRREQ